MVRRRGLTLIGFALYAVLIMVLVAGLLSSSPGTVVRSVSADNLKDQVGLVDNALAQWYGSHSGVYPSSLLVLKDLEILPLEMDVAVFDYTVRNSNTQYRLTVALPVGGTYVSPGSKF